MVKLGRPKTINKNQILEKSYDILWSRGIQNTSFNEIIKNTDVSKGTIYKLFKTQDNLHKETIAFYRDNYVNSKIKIFSEYNDVFLFLNALKKEIGKKNCKPCFYQITKTVSHMLGKKAQSSLKNIDRIIKKEWGKLINRHITKYNLDAHKINISSLALFLFHNINYLYILKQNNIKTSEINDVINIIKNKTLSELT